MRWNRVLNVVGCHAEGELGHVIIGTRFEAGIDGLTDVGGIPAVIPSVAGQAWITYMAQVGLDPGDPFPEGFTLSDTWLQTVDGPPVRP